MYLKFCTFVPLKNKMIQLLNAKILGLSIVQIQTLTNLSLEELEKI